MAEAELSIEYRDWPTTLINVVSSILWPVSMLLLVWSTVVLIANCLDGTIHAGPALILSSFNVLLVTLCGFVVFLSSDRTIFITRDGLGMPFFVCMGPWFRVKKRWGDLLNVQFNASGGGQLKLVFKNAQPVTLKLSKLEPAHIDGLVMALDVWAEGSDFSALLDARAFIYRKAGGDLPELDTASHSYTELWHEELARRFGSTTFIPLEPGDQVQGGLYKIEKQLAFGGLSAIYLARKDHERVVLKEAVVPDSSDEELKEQSYSQLKREADMLSRLSHEQIARVFDHFVDKGRHYLVIEYLTGEDMRRYVKENGPQPQGLVVDWAIEMAEILAYLHEQPEPILHRDFTPDNLILRPDNRIALIDFGASNFFLGTATGTMIGKQAYIAPEQLRGKANPRSDIYAMGGSLFFLLTGQDPEPLTASQPATVKSGVNPQLDKLIGSMTAMEDEDRPKSARTVWEQLQELRGLHV